MIKQIVDYGNKLEDPLRLASNIYVVSNLGVKHEVLLTNRITIEYDDPILLETARLVEQKRNLQEFTMVLSGYHNAIVIVEIGEIGDIEDLYNEKQGKKIVGWRSPHEKAIIQNFRDSIGENDE